jgi:hypothetical protein
MFNEDRASAGLIQPSRGVRAHWQGAVVLGGAGDHQIALICTQQIGEIAKDAAEQAVPALGPYLMFNSA